MAIHPIEFKTFHLIPHIICQVVMDEKSRDSKLSCQEFFAAAIWITSDHFICQITETTQWIITWSKRAIVIVLKYTASSNQLPRQSQSVSEHHYLHAWSKNNVLVSTHLISGSVNQPLRQSLESLKKKYFYEARPQGQYWFSKSENEF